MQREQHEVHTFMVADQKIRKVIDFTRWDDGDVSISSRLLIGDRTYGAVHHVRLEEAAIPALLEFLCDSEDAANSPESGKATDAPSVPGPYSGTGAD